MPGSGFGELMGLQWEERKNKRGSKIRGVIRCLGAPFPPAEGRSSCCLQSVNERRS